MFILAFYLSNRGLHGKWTTSYKNWPNPGSGLSCESQVSLIFVLHSSLIDNTHLIGSRKNVKADNTSIRQKKGTYLLSNFFPAIFWFIQGVSKRIDLLYLLNISGTKQRISKPFFSSENWDPYVNFEYRTISVRY